MSARDAAMGAFRRLSRALRSTPLRRVPGIDRIHDRFFRLLSGGGSVRVGDARLHLGRTAGMAKKLVLYGEAEGPLGRILADALRPGDVAFDVGAHVGVYTVPMSRAVGHTGTVLAFEPNPETRRLLERNLRDNGCSNVEVVDRALADREGSASLFEHEQPGFTSLRRFGRGAREHRIETVTLDGYLRGRGLVPRLLKIDVEGAEGLVLRGAAATLAAEGDRVVAVELHPVVREFGGTVEDGLSPLVDASYRLFRARTAEGGDGLVETDREELARLLERDGRKLPVVAARGAPVEALRRTWVRKEPP